MLKASLQHQAPSQKHRAILTHATLALSVNHTDMNLYNDLLKLVNEKYTGLFYPPFA
jgi:hypothetical protein